MTNTKVPDDFVDRVRVILKNDGREFDEAKYKALGDKYRPIEDGEDADLFGLQSGLEAEFGIEIDNRAITFSSTLTDLHRIVKSELVS